MEGTMKFTRDESNNLHIGTASGTLLSVVPLYCSEDIVKTIIFNTIGQ
jgi:hypothetical protein